jgi:tetratricopeptide (TPR) repeat protein
MSALNDVMQNTAGRVIRVFISSTFRDMMRERDLLVKNVFPALRLKCAQRFVTFTEVDLRWGITEEQANEGQVLPLCLAEIERSRPYFIGLLGERYGWIPETIRSEVIEREPWLKEHVLEHTSVTELEILHGVLNNPKMQSHAFFYFRDPNYLPPNADPAMFYESDIQLKKKLVALKARIHASGLPVVDPYTTPENLAELIHQQLNALIDELYPDTNVPDALTQERWAHEAYAMTKHFACIDRPMHLAALSAFANAERNGQGLIVTGESGGGKTTLLATWASNWAMIHPDDFLFQHYFGATTASASPDGFLRRLLGELKRRFEILDEIPTDHQKLRDTLPIWLAQTLNRGRIVLVLDGLNQVQGIEPNCHLTWLPRCFSPNVTVIASTLLDPLLYALRERGWAEYELPLANEGEVVNMIDVYLDIYARKLSAHLHQTIVKAPGSRNPLFLRTLLEELRQFGSFEKLPVRIAYYLEADTPCDLFVRVLHRLHEDFDGKDSQTEFNTMDIVQRALTYLWASREGLSEVEWLELLGVNNDPLPRVYWTPLIIALEPHLSHRAGLYAFGHDYLRQAVELEWLQDTESQRKAHIALADYFEFHTSQKDMSLRKSSEWPYQLYSAEMWDRLQTCLTDLSLFMALYNERTKWEITGYWHPLRRQGRDMGNCYTAAYDRWVAVPVIANNHEASANLGAFLLDNGLYPAAEPLLRRALETRERVLGSEHPITLTSINSLAKLLYSEGDYVGAEQLYRRALESRERVLGSEHPDTLQSVNNLAVLLQSKGDFMSAEPLYRHALETRERVLGAEHSDTLKSLNNLALLLSRNGDYISAEPLLRRALETRERVLGSEHPDTLQSVNNLASLFYSESKYVGAESLLRRALETRERVLGPEHPDTLQSVNNLALLLYCEDDYVGAEPLYRRALQTRERVLGVEHPDTLESVNNLALLCCSKGDYVSAEQLYRRALEGLIHLSALDGYPHSNLQTVIVNYKVCLEEQGVNSESIQNKLEAMMSPFAMGK